MYRRYLFVTLFCVLCLQFFNIPVGGTHLKPYMLVTVFQVCSLVLLNGFPVNKFKTHEIIWLVTYALSFISIIYAPDTKLAIQLLLGQSVLVLFFILFRLLLVCNNDTDPLLYRSFSIYIFVSLVFYIIGCFQVFLIGDSGFFYQLLNEKSYRVWGCYFEGGEFPRLMGLSESPNNYAYFSITVLWWSIWKEKTKLAYITALSIFLTLSTSAIVVLCVQGIIYAMYKRKINWKTVFLLVFTLIIGYRLYSENDFIHNMLEVRMARNATGSGRFNLWKLTCSYIENRLILGYGANQFRYVMSETGYMSAHNNLLETVFSTGVVGGFFYVCFIISFFVYSIRLTHRVGDLFFVLMSIAFILFGVSNNTLTIEFTPFILALFYGYEKRTQDG